MYGELRLFQINLKKLCIAPETKSATIETPSEETQEEKIKLITA